MESQSLWNRAVSSDNWAKDKQMSNRVSIPLEQGSVFRLINNDGMQWIDLSQSLWNRAVSSDWASKNYFKSRWSLNPFGTGQCLPTLVRAEELRMLATSQSLWNRAVSSDSNEEKQSVKYSLNPFGTGQCLPTAVVFWSLVAQGLREPLPNFFRDLESWVLIWLNIVQFLTFYSLIKRSKTEGILPEFLDFTSLNSLKIPNKS